MTKFLNTDVDITLGGSTPSDEKVSSQKAVKTYIDANAQIIQIASLPTASSSNENRIYQYIGATTGDYVNGSFYQCVAQGTNPETYAWEQVFVQAAMVITNYTV